MSTICAESSILSYNAKMIALLLCFGLILTVAWWCIQYYHFFNGLWKIPTPKWLVPVFGNIFEASSAESAYWDLHNLAMTCGRRKYIRGALGFHFGIMVMEPQMLEHLLTHSSTINKARPYSFIHRWLGTGLLTSSRSKWQGRRKLLTPAYHFQILEQFIDVFDKNTKIMVEKIKQEIGRDSINVYPYVTLCTLDIICETAMGTPVNAQENSNSEYVTAINNLSIILIKRMVSLLKHFDIYYQFTEDYRKEMKNLKIVHDYTRSVIQSRRKELVEKQQSAKIEVKSTENFGYKEKIPFLDILLQASFNGVSLSDEDIREEVDTFMFEGHDTTSAAISFCLYNLAKYPKIQLQVLNEQRFIYGTSPTRDTTYQDLKEMKYLEMVIKETLRLYPSVPIFGRVVSEAFTYDGMTFKSGSLIGILVYSMHRNPDIYPDPEVFDPERFTPEEISKRHPFAYLPFSAGFRNCIGQKFAMMEMKATIARMVRSFHFLEAPNSELKLTSRLVLSSSTGVNIKLKERVW